MTDDDLDDRRALGRAKEIKVRIPVEFHIKLHSLRILNGLSISAVVADALTAYFRDEDGKHL